MIQKTKRIELTLKTNSAAAREVAEAVMFRANPHQSSLAAKRLDEAGVTVENLMKYFTELTKAVAEFWNSNWDMSYVPTLKSHELRGMYLPVIYSVILSSVGNLKQGNYEYVIKASGDCEKPEKDFLIKFSAALETVRDLVRGDIGQVGNRNAQAQSAVMLCLLGDVSEDGRTAEVLIHDGTNHDMALAGLSALVGVSLVNEAYSILYTGVDEVNFRQLTNTLVEKGLVEAKKAVSEK